MITSITSAKPVGPNAGQKAKVHGVNYTKRVESCSQLPNGGLEVALFNFCTLNY